MNKDLIDKSIRTGELQLTFWENVGHYKSAIFISCIPVVLICLSVYDLISGNVDNIKRPEILLSVGLVSLLLSLIVYRIQKKRLKFLTIVSKLEQEQLINTIERTIEDLNWKLVQADSQSIIVRTWTKTLFLIWSEQITILFNRDKIFINSINNPDDGALISKGRNAKNINVLLERIKSASR